MPRLASNMVLQAAGQVACPSGLVRSIAIARHTGLESRQISDACAKLESNGLLTHKKYADGTIKPGCYLLTAAGRAALESGVSIKSGPKCAHGNRHVPRMTMDALAKFGATVPSAIPDLLEPQLLTFASDRGMMVVGFEEIAGCRYYQGWWIQWVDQGSTGAT